MPAANTTGGVNFKMSSVYHGDGFWMKGVGSQIYNYIYIADSANDPKFRINNLGIASFYENTYFYSDIYFVSTASGIIQHDIDDKDISIKVKGTGAIKMYVDGAEIMSIDDIYTRINTANVEFNNSYLAEVSSISAPSDVDLQIIADASDYRGIKFTAGTGGIVLSIWSTIVRVSSAVVFEMEGSTFRVKTTKTPASSSAAGTMGDICSDSNYLYRWFATNQVKRIAWSSF